MIVLWVFTGIIFSLLLLLCFPLTLAVSYADKAPSKKDTEDSPAMQGCAMQDLPKESTVAILSQLIMEAQHTLLQQAKPEKEFRLTLLFLCFRFQLFPLKPKKIKSKKEKPKKDEEEPVPKEKKQKKSEPKSLREIIDFGLQVWERVKKPLKRICGDILIHDLHLKIVVCKENAADTAISYGILHGAVYGLLAEAVNYINIRKTKIDIQTDFIGEAGDITGSFRVSLHPIVVLGASLQMFVSILLLFMQTFKPRKNS